jgi:hypothetical protein
MAKAAYPTNWSAKRMRCEPWIEKADVGELGGDMGEGASGEDADAGEDASGEGIAEDVDMEENVTFEAETADGMDGMEALMGGGDGGGTRDGDGMEGGGAGLADTDT